MKWTEEHDELLVREILTVEPFMYKPSTRESGKAWTQIAEILNAIPSPNFRVTQRSVRDHYGVLEKQFTQKIAAEEKSSGVDPPDLTEVEVGLQEIVEKTQEAALHYDDDNQKAKADADRAKAEEVRKTCMETFTETRKRVGSSPEDESPKVSQKRGTGSETILFLQSKAEKDSELRKREIELRTLEVKQREKASDDQQKVLTELMKQQQSMQQQQQAMFMANMQQQQQQSQLFMALLETLKK